MRKYNRELSWLQFNERVLQEANDTSVPLISRIRFLGVFSKNLDEFFQVRYAIIKKTVQLQNEKNSIFNEHRARELLEAITNTVIKQQTKSLDILNTIIEDLKKENIFIINEKNVGKNQVNFIKNYFINVVNQALVTIIINKNTDFSSLRGNAIYLAVKLVLKNDDLKYALIEIPNTINRFIVLPKDGDKDYIIMLDDLIRYNLNTIFEIFDYKTVASYMIKITRDAELDIEVDLSKSFIEKISESVADRKKSAAVRLVFDKKIDAQLLELLKRKIKINNTDSLIPGGRYHNRKDYVNFPDLNKKHLYFKPLEPLTIKGFNFQTALFPQINQDDFLQFTPYHTFAYVVKFLREAALDPNVNSIYMTLYRLAKHSHIASSLINAAKNGKKVTALIELQARFDEKANIEYAEELESAGVIVIFGIPGLKVHSKMCLVERQEEKNIKYYGVISTGNFNESTAKIYTDYTLYTANQKLLKDVKKVFTFLLTNYYVPKYKHLLVSPHYTEKEFIKLIHQEIKFAVAGKPAFIKLKMNSLTSNKMINKLYEASQKGVKIKMIVRGICCLIPGVPNLSENIEAISIIDRFLEHTRMYIFGNNGNPKIFISSADWMSRNLRNRVEISCPIYNTKIKQELLDHFNISWNDSKKARVFSSNQDNAYRNLSKNTLSSQNLIYRYYTAK